MSLLPSLAYFHAKSHKVHNFDKEVSTIIRFDPVCHDKYIIFSSQSAIHILNMVNVGHVRMIHLYSTFSLSCVFDAMY